MNYGSANTTLNTNEPISPAVTHSYRDTLKEVLKLLEDSHITMNELTGNMAADPTVVPDGHSRLGELENMLRSVETSTRDLNNRLHELMSKI